MNKKIALLLDKKVAEYNRPEFIPHDPISIPHQFTKQQDIEIAGFFASIFAWGNRTTIINKTNQLMQLMEGKPYEFCMEYADHKLKNLLPFRHRTFQATDLLYCIDFFHFHYSKNTSLETAFSKGIKRSDANVENGLRYFHQYFFSLPDAPQRTQKHIATPERASTCKRLNMYLRWMVRNDNNGVDFGIWNKISPSQLICPIDVHVARVARKLGLITRKQTDWLTAVELTDNLKKLDPKDPAKYDFALFGMGVNEG